MRKQLLMSIMAAMLLTMVAQAETVKWVIKPEYKKIVRYSEDLFKCQKDNGKYLLISTSGNPVMQEEFDSITDYAGGYALALKQSGNRYQILGFVSEQASHSYQNVSGEYYMARYSFFSEHCLVVANKDGKQGYLNTSGQSIIECKYLEARPFKFGYASVVVKKRKDGLYDVNYINQNDKTNGPLRFSSQLTFGTSFNEGGYAIVGNHKKYAVIDQRFNIISSTTRPDIENIRTYDFTYTKGDKNWTPDGNQIPSIDSSFEVTSKDGVLGYAKKGKTMVPEQFSDAKGFANGYAVAAASNGKYGVLQLLQGEFEPNWPDKKYVKVYNGQKCDHLRFSLGIPNSLVGAKLSFDNGKGMMEKEEHDFRFKPVFGQGAKNCRLQAKVVSEDGLLLWEGEKDLQLIYIKIDVTKPVVTTVYADENDNQTVKTVVTNSSAVKVKVNATLKVGGKSSTVNEELAPGQSKTLTVTLKVSEDMNGKSEAASVNVKVDGDYDAPEASSTVKLQLI